MGLLVPTGTVGVFDYHEQLATLDEEQRQRLRAVILSHNNDPIVVHGTDRADATPWSWNGPNAPRPSTGRLLLHHPPTGRRPSFQAVGPSRKANTSCNAAHARKASAVQHPHVG